MSDPFPYIATIKHLYTSPTGTNIVDDANKGCNGAPDPRLITYTNVMDIAGNLVPVQWTDARGNVPKRTWSGTFGDGNVSFSLPKEDECIHGSSKFICVRCVGRLTTEPSKPDCSVKKGRSSSPLSSPNGTSGMCSSLRPQSPSALFEPSPSETTSNGLYNRPARTLSFAQ